MKKILFFTTSYYPMPDANGICVNEIANELSNQGHEVHIIYYQQDKSETNFSNNGIYGYGVEMPLYRKLSEYSKQINNFKVSELYKKLSVYVQRFKLLMYLPFYPVTSITFILKHYKLASELHKEYKFDIVISSYKSIEGLIASNFLKKKNKKVKLIMYVLDSLSNVGRSTFFNAAFVDKMGWKWEKRLYKDADLILNMKAHEKHHNQSRYNPFKSKMNFVDIPLLKKRDNRNSKNIKNEAYIDVVYTGTLNSLLRNPKYACELFKNIPLNNYKVNFYSQGDCENMLEEYQEKTNGKIMRNGFIPHEDSLEKIDSASFLLSIGNTNSDMIPSKIFEYMSTGKPIIHFYDNDYDSSLPYLKNYPLALLVKSDIELLESNTVAVLNFIKNTIGKTVSFEEIETIFKYNKPEYTVDRILEV